MALAAGAVAGMALMEMRFVLDMQALRCESSHQLRRDDIPHSHLVILEAIRLAAPSAWRINESEALTPYNAV
jgi:hypothetical protein